MIVITSGQIEGRRIAKTIGLVKGSTIRARHLKMMAEAREEAIQRMVEDAEKQGANAIVSMRLATSMIMQNAAEVLAYGTGVVLE